MHAFPLLTPHRIGDGIAGLLQFFIFLLPTRGRSSFRRRLGLPASCCGFLDPRAPLAKIGRRRRLGVVLCVELRGGAAIIDARHLPRQLAEVARRLGCDKERNVLAMPGERHIARGAAPMRAVVEVGLVERAPLPFVDRPRIAVAEPVEFTTRVIVDRRRRRRGAQPCPACHRAQP